MRSKQVCFLSCLIFTGLFTSTAHAGIIKKSEKSGIQSGQLGGIIPSITESGNKCLFGEMAFRNIHTRKIYTGKFSNQNYLDKAFGKTKARVLPVPPGYYQPHYVECVWKTSVLRQTQYFRGLDRRFQPILIRGGEVVYYGTFDAQVHPRTNNYNINLIGNPSYSYDGLLRADPTLARHFVVRPAQRR